MQQIIYWNLNVLYNKGGPMFMERLENFLLYPGNITLYELPEIKDPDYDKYLVKADNSMCTFVKYFSKKLMMTPQILDIGSCILSITLKDINLFPK
jgi:hypothetical protein